MSIKITYFVHGTTFDNEEHVSSGWKNVELSPLGVQQSIDLAEQIKDQKFDVVFCSDLKRAYDSAQLMFDEMVEIVADGRLRECNYGVFNGLPSQLVEPMQESSIHVPFPQGESYEDVKTRMEDFISYLRENYDGKHVAIVSHKAPQLALEVLLKGRAWEEVFSTDWRRIGAWQPGWEYVVESAHEPRVSSASAKS